MEFFDSQGFNTLYLNTSKYQYKEKLLDSFYYVWIDVFGPLWPLHLRSWDQVKSWWTAANKKTIKVRLQGQGYSPAGIDGLFRTFEKWMKAH